MRAFDLLFSFFGLVLGLSVAVIATAAARAFKHRKTVPSGWKTPMHATFVTLILAVMCIGSPAQAHQYIAHFEYGRTELSPRGYNMVREVAAYAQNRPTECIYIRAHMDTAEATEFSDELSRQRAQVVATELVRLGIDPAIIKHQGRGASSPARVTEPNTPEILNRHVTVDFSSRTTCDNLA